jgi:hypothetical protein
MSETPDIRTKFRLDGLKQAATQLRSFSRRARDSFEIARDSGRRAFEPALQRLAQLRAAMLALTRIVRTTTVRAFRTLGTVGVRSLRGITVAARTAGRALRTGLLGISAAGVAAGVGLTNVVNKSAEFVELQSRFARAGGTSVRAFSRLSYAARQFGVESDEVLGALSTLSDRIAEAARGEGAADYFRALGVSVVDSRGRLRDSVAVLLDLVDATQRLNATARANVFNELLGGDAEKLAGLLSLGSRDIVRIGAEAEIAGVALDESDVRLARLYSIRVRQLQESFRGLGLEIARRLYPAFAEMSRTVANFVVVHRREIANWVVRAWNAVVSVVRDVVNLFRGLDGGVRNRWLIELRNGLSGLVEAIRQVVPAISTLRSIADAALGALGSGLLSVIAFASDFGRILGGQAAVSYSVLNDLVAQIADAYEWVLSFGEALAAVLSGGDAEGEFGYLNDIRDRVLEVSESFETAWGWFRRTYDFLSSALRTAFDWDLTSTLLYIGLLRLSGLLPLILAPLRLLVSLLGGAAGVGSAVAGGLAGLAGRAAAGAAVSGGLAAAFTAVGASATGAVAAIGSAGVALGLLISKGLEWIGVSRQIGNALTRLTDAIGITDFAGERAASLAYLRAVSSASVPKIGSAMQAVGGVPDLSSDEALAAKGIEILGYSTRPGVRPINLNIGGETYAMTASEDVAERLQRDLARSGRARTAALPSWLR